jgi:toxin-antitoxin system PIN domain toxin
MRRLVDTSVWLALALEFHEFHAITVEWLGGLTSNEAIVFCRSTQQSFLRLLTTSTVFGPHELPPLTNRQSWATYELWAARDNVAFVEEPPGLDVQWRIFSTRTSSSPKIWMDSYLAAFAIAGGYQLVTLDAGFRQFAGLDVVVLAA